MEIETNIIESAIRKYIEIQNKVDVDVSSISLSSNHISSKDPVVFNNSNVTFNQSNDIIQNIELLYIIDEAYKYDLTDEESEIINSIIATNGGFYTQDELRSVLNLPSDSLVEIDGSEVIVTHSNGSVDKYTLDFLVQELSSEYIKNINIYIENRKKLSMMLTNALKSMQSNQMELSGCKFIDSQADFVQLNKAIQEIKSKNAITEDDDVKIKDSTEVVKDTSGDLNTNVNPGENTNETNTIVEDTPTNLNNDNKVVVKKDFDLAKFIFIVVLILAIALFTASLILLYLSPSKSKTRT